MLASNLVRSPHSTSVFAEWTCCQTWPRHCSAALLNPRKILFLLNIGGCPLSHLWYFKPNSFDAHEYDSYWFLGYFLFLCIFWIYRCNHASPAEIELHSQLLPFVNCTEAWLRVKSLLFDNPSNGKSPFSTAKPSACVVNVALPYLITKKYSKNWDGYVARKLGCARVKNMTERPPFLLQVNFYDSVRQLRSSPFPSFFISKLSRRSTIVQSWVAHSMIHWLIVLVAGIRSSGCFPWCVVQWNEDSPPGKEGTGWGWLQSMDVVFENQLKSHIVVLQWTGHWLVWKQELTLSSIKRQLLHWGQSWWTITRWALDGQVITIVHKYITHCISKTLYLSI